MSSFPWTVKFCDGLALQFLIFDAEGQIVLMSECSSFVDCFYLMDVFKQNENIKVDTESLENLLQRATSR